MRRTETIEIVAFFFFYRSAEKVFPRRTSLFLTWAHLFLARPLTF